MAKKSRSKISKKVLAFDLGGTKVAAAIVSDRGDILAQLREPVFLKDGFNGLIDQMSGMGLKLMGECSPSLGSVAGSAVDSVVGCVVASAGPLDPVRGNLLNPTNLKTGHRNWGVVPLARILERKLHTRVLIENDAAAAAMAEKWLGNHAKTNDLIMITIGTGLGAGIILDGKLLRGGRNLHTEVGHICISKEDRGEKCGCGNYGCAEALLSGPHFIARVQKKWRRKNLSGAQLLDMVGTGHSRAVSELNFYGQTMAVFVYSLVVSFSPEKIIFGGGFSHFYEYFRDSLNEELKRLLRTRREGIDLLPNIGVSKLRDEMGLLGAASVGFERFS